MSCGDSLQRSQQQPEIQIIHTPITIQIPGGSGGSILASEGQQIPEVKDAIGIHIRRSGGCVRYPLHLVHPSRV